MSWQEADERLACAREEGAAELNHRCQLKLERQQRDEPAPEDTK